MALWASAQFCCSAAQSICGLLMKEIKVQCSSENHCRVLDEVMTMLPPKMWGMVCTCQRGIGERHDVQTPLLVPQMQTSHHILKLSFPNKFLWKTAAELALITQDSNYFVLPHTNLIPSVATTAYIILTWNFSSFQSLIPWPTLISMLVGNRIQSPVSRSFFTIHCISDLLPDIQFFVVYYQRVGCGGVRSFLSRIVCGRVVKWHMLL